MNDVQIVDRTEARAAENRLRAVREIAKVVREFKLSGFDPALALLDKAAKLDASLRERATHVRDVVHSNAVPALIASGEITDEVLASFRQAAPSPDEIARLTTAVQHAVAAILRDAVAAAVAAGPATYTALVKVADKAVTDAGKVAAKVLPEGHTRVPRDDAQALAAGVAQSDLDALTAAYDRWALAHYAYALLRELRAVPLGRGGVENGWSHYARPWTVVRPGQTIASRALRLASAIVNGAKPGMYDVAAMVANGQAWSDEKAELLAKHEKARHAAARAHDHRQQVATAYHYAQSDATSESLDAAGRKAAAKKAAQLATARTEADKAFADAIAERDKLDIALRTISKWAV